MRTKIILLVVLAILILPILPILSIQAESLVGGNSYTLSWYVIGGGGSTFGSADNYTLGSTIGQPSAGTYNGDPYTLSSGFWARPMTQIERAHQIYLPLVIN